jgi:SpoVK/Ycf46/Vps4 family AAA+-type ATPase
MELLERVTERRPWSDLRTTAADLEALDALRAKLRELLRAREPGKRPRASGSTVLFTGADRAGKSVAAQVLGSALALEVYRIDLRAALSAYGAETERSLDRLLTSAVAAPVVLLFDEADALFGKRSSTEPTDDRYRAGPIAAVDRCLSRQSGLAIIACDHADDLDPAFLKRMGERIAFPVPDPRSRAARWEKQLPTP